MKVVIDSNILIADFRMKSPNFKILLENSRSGKIDLRIPEIVIDEVVNKFQQRIAKSQEVISSELDKLQKLTADEMDTPFDEDFVADRTKEYKRLMNRTIRQNKITILDYPRTEHKVLARKAMQVKKPFNSNEKGYRDSLIWENIKTLISSVEKEIAASPELVFITNNYKDFVGSENVLHSDLIDELENEGLYPDSIEIYESLSEFTEKVTKLYLAQADMFKEKLKNNEFWDFELKSTIDKFLFKEFLGSQLYNYYNHAPHANDVPTISSINDDYKIEDIQVKKLSAAEYIVDVDINLDIELDYFVDKHDYWSAEEVEYSIQDSDWNDHVMHVTNISTIPISITLIINSKLECKSIQISKIDNKYE